MSGCGRQTRGRGAALVEFALAWPLALLVVLGSVELAVWGVEAYAARAAALAGARAGSVAGVLPETAVAVARRALNPSLVGASAGAWCPGQPPPAPAVWICAKDLGSAIEVVVGGDAPAPVPLTGGHGLPLGADIVLQKEVFTS
ncbi:MAG: TadE family protein [Candidatus Dormibacterales bacterium]